MDTFNIRCVLIKIPVCHCDVSFTILIYVQQPSLTFCHTRSYKWQQSISLYVLFNLHILQDTLVA